MTPTDHARRMFAAFDAKDVSGLAAFVTDDVRLRLGNAQAVHGKPAFIEEVNAFRLRDGLVAEYRSYIDATPVYS